MYAIYSENQIYPNYTSHIFFNTALVSIYIVDAEGNFVPEFADYTLNGLQVLIGKDALLGITNTNVKLYDNPTESYREIIAEESDGVTTLKIVADSRTNSRVISKLDGTIEDFLSSQQDSYWADALAETERIIHSAELIATERLEHILPFKKGTAYVKDGRTFTPEEENEGGNVCIISADFAGSSEIQVGDTLSLDIYSGYYTDYNPNNKLYMIQQKNVHTPIVTKDYTVVGLCSLPKLSSAGVVIPINTIIIPSSSLSDEEFSIASESMETRPAYLSTRFISFDNLQYFDSSKYYIGENHEYATASGLSKSFIKNLNMKMIFGILDLWISTIAFFSCSSQNASGATLRC